MRRETRGAILHFAYGEAMPSELCCDLDCTLPYIGYHFAVIKTGNKRLLSGRHNLPRETPMPLSVTPFRRFRSHVLVRSACVWPERESAGASSSFVDAR